MAQARYASQPAGGSMKSIEVCPQFTLPESATDDALARCYAWDIARDPRMAFGLTIATQVDTAPAKTKLSFSLESVATHNNRQILDIAPGESSHYEHLESVA